MRTIKHIPIRYPTGVITGEVLATILDSWQRELLAQMDLRNPQSDFAAGVVATDDGVLLGTEARPTGRLGTSIPTLFQRISDAGRASDQRFLHPITVGNRNSVQSIDAVVTAASGPTSSTISVEAHSVKYDFGSVSYGSGSISGLDTETVYLVYTSDPDFAGGAVTYYATEDPNDLIGTGTYYVGSIETPPAGTSATISTASSTNPIECTTATDHGWVTGNTIDFASMPGDFAALNTGTYTMTKTADDRFTVPVDGSTFAAYSSGGLATRIVTDTSGGGGAGGGGGGSRWDGLVAIP